MPKEEWGTKRICPTTGRRFYDLGKTPIVSPYTGETVTVDANTRTRVAVEAKAKTPEPEEVVEDQDEVLVEDDADLAVGDELLEDEDEDDDTVSLDEIADVASPEDDS